MSLEGDDANIFWLLFGAVLVFFMQTGFAMLEVGCVQPKNTKNILIKNVFDASIGAICWWFVGFGVAQGTSDGEFIGKDAFFLKGSTFMVDGEIQGGAYAGWLFQWAFAATAATIVSGAIAERATFTAYLAYSVVLTTFIYPVVVHWGWSAGGWASAWREDNLLSDCGVIDFAGSGVVHMTGGLAALVAAKIIGPREGRFEGQIPDEGQSLIFQTLGTLILWFGWYGFNGVSTLAITGLAGVAAKTMVTTTIAAAAGCITTVAIGKLDPKKGFVDASLANNGILAGLVAITAGCSVVEPEGAFIIGILAGPVYYYSSSLLEKLGIDDVVSAAPVHFFCGAWGVIAAGLFATEDNYAAAYYGDRASECCGAFYGCGGAQLGANIIFVVAVIAWVGVLSFLLFGGLSKAGVLRIDSETEEIGIDLAKMSPAHYNPNKAPKQVNVTPDDEVAASEEVVPAGQEAALSV